MPDTRKQIQPPSPMPSGGGDDSTGPATPKVEKPDVSDLLKRMRKVDPDQAKRYRQRTGQ